MNTSSPTGCSPTADDAFGPVVQVCRDGFDFTITFEQYILILLPAALLILAAPLRLYQLRKSPRAVAGLPLKLAKVTAIATLAALQLALLALWAARSPPAPLRTASVAATGVSFASSLLFCALSHAEHARSPRPSSLLGAYLLVSLVLDAALLRSLWLSVDSIDRSIRAVFTAAFALKATILLLEGKEKTKYLVPGGRAPSPEETSGLYSRGVFWWLTPLLVTGFRRVLKPLDLFALDESMSAATLNERFWLHWNQGRAGSSHGEHRLIRVCISTMLWPLVQVVVPRLFLLVFTICQPLALNRFLVFLQDDESKSTGYGLIAAYGLIYLGISISTSFYQHKAVRSLTMLRGVLVTAIFSKTTERSITAGEDSAAVTLMSTDVDSIVRAVKEIHEFWANLIQIALATWLLSTQIGLASSGPIVVCLLSLVATTLIAPRSRKFQLAWVKKVQKRVGITSAMIGHIKSIKMSGLTQKLSSTISNLRLIEINAAGPLRMVGAVTSAVAQIPIMISPVAAFALFTIVSSRTGETLDSTRMFAALSWVILLAQPLFWMFEVVLNLGAALASFKRIENYLSENSRVEYRELSGDNGRGSLAQPNASGPADIELQNLKDKSLVPSVQVNSESVNIIQVQGASFSWSADGTAILEDVNFGIRDGHLAMLVGPVASGKTTLLKGLLGEVPYIKGKIHLSRGRHSWCEQSPWLINETVQKNIVGFATLNQELYDQVIKACDLEKDIAQLPKGDQTVIGSKGLALSGGQKQRVALARAVYSRPQVALFDDIFSGLDNHTARAVFQRVFSPKEGILRKWGTTILLATQSVNFLPSADLIIALDKDKNIPESGSFEQLRSSGGYVQGLLVGHGDDANNDITPAEPEKESDKTTTPSVIKSAKGAAKQEDKRRQIGDLTVYMYYFGNVGFFATLAFVFTELAWAFFSTFPTVWLNFWANSNAEAPNQRTGYYLGVYTVLQVVGIFSFGLTVWFGLLVVAVRSGISLHQRLLNTVMQAPLSLFTGTDLGSITTRFSQDVGLLDRSLPLALTVALASFFICIGKAILIASASWYIAITFPALIAVFYYLQKAYLRTSRQLRLLDLEEKAPVYAQFLETLSGLATLRAFGWTTQSIDRNHTLVDGSQRPFYLLLMVQQWLNLVLDLITTALALLVVGLATYLRSTVSIGLTGVSLVQLLSFTEAIKMLIQFWTALETSIGAVARIKQFSEETKEENLVGETGVAPASWPWRGQVEIQGISASYGEDNEIKALDGISLSIQPGEKIGICGRTGSGKSSLFLSILRLLDYSAGSITVDGIDLSTLKREEIRSKLIAITQDQFVLPGTVRQNIDPLEISNDEKIIAVLTRLGLWDAIQDKGGLEKDFEEDMLSHGQKQLFFLARAILRKDSGRLILLDEATSSVDQHTENMVQQVVREEFADHTLISIAHRLDTIIDFDRVVVLEKGCIVELGSPRELLDSGRGKFKDLWDASRRTEFSRHQA